MVPQGAILFFYAGRQIMEKMTFYAPSRVHCTFGALGLLREVRSLVGSRLLLVTEKELEKSRGLLKIRETAAAEGIELVTFSDINHESTSYSIIEASEMARASKAQGVIGFGGIRALSAAKAVSVGTGYGRKFYNVFNGEPPESPLLPYIEIPGVFRNPFMLAPLFALTDARNGRKYILQVENSQPAVVLIDPEVYGSLPLSFRFSVLMDTFLESIEGYFSSDADFISDTFLLKSVAMIVSLLPGLRKDPENPENLMKAAMAGLSSALGLSRGLTGLGTACAFEIDHRFAKPHSAVATILLPYMLEYGLKIHPEKVSRMGPILGENITGLSVVAAADRVIETLRASVGGGNLPGRLSELGLNAENLSTAAERVTDYPMVRRLPGGMSVEDIYTFLKEAL